MENLVFRPQPTVLRLQRLHLTEIIYRKIKARFRGLLQYFMFILFLLFFQTGFAQDSTICIVSDTSTQMQPMAGSNMNCDRVSDVYLNFLKAKENFIPYDLIHNERTIKKKIKIKLVIVNDGRPNYQDNSTDRQLLQDLVDYANSMLSDLQSPSDPQTNICGSCHIIDSRFRLELQDIIFTNQIEYEGQDSILHIFILPPNGSGQGMASNVGGKNNFWSNPYLWVQSFGTDPPGIDLWQNARALVHEIGHIFTLMHMYDGCCWPESCDANSYDYLRDIFNEGSLAWCPSQNVNYSCIPNDPNTLCTNNFMDYRMWQYFSPMQLGIMHREASLGAIHRFVFPDESPQLHPWNITSTQTWDFPIRVFSDIVVKSGNTLTISCEVQMPPGSRILVEKNAKLIIDGGKVTSFHGKTEWTGIELTGDESKTPLPQYQGFLELKNGAIIENAFIAITNYTLDNGAHGGGIIKAKDSKIYNCWRSVALNGYGTYSYNYLNQSQCQFDNMEFLIDNISVYQFHPSAQAFITAFDIRGGVSITNSSFKNLIPLSEREQGDRNPGIYTLSSGFYVDNCTFDGLRQGVYYAGYAGFPTRMNQVYNNTFENITDNILFAASAFGNIRGNHISKMRSHPIFTGDTQNGNGIYLDNTQFTNVTCENIVDGSGYNSFYSYGTIIKNSNGYGANVLDNSFLNLTAGAQTQKNNPNLNILCNVFEDNYNAFLVNPQSNSSSFYLKDQGNGCDPTSEYRAGNQFISNQYDIVSYLSNQWSYFYWYAPSFVPNQIPLSTMGNLNIQGCVPSTPMTDPNSQCNLSYNCVDLLTPLEINTALSSYNILKRSSLKNSVEGRILFSNIIQGYNYVSDSAGLETFLEDEDDDNSRKLLIALYLESKRFSKLTQTIDELTFADEDDKQAYSDYYDVLIQQKTDGRRAYELTEEEESVVRTLAASDYEVASFAKGLLEWALDEPWLHEIEEQGALPMAYQIKFDEEKKNSELKDAVPNPTNGLAKIETQLTKEDANNNALLIIRDIQGQERLRISLNQEVNETVIDTRTWESGIYFYSLEINGKTLRTKKMSVQK